MGNSHKKIPPEISNDLIQNLQMMDNFYMSKQYSHNKYMKITRNPDSMTVSWTDGNMGIFEQLYDVESLQIPLLDEKDTIQLIKIIRERHPYSYNIQIANNSYLVG